MIFCFCPINKFGCEVRSDMNIKNYLERIGLGDARLTPDEESLRSLQRSHLLTVPFENLDIHWKRPIVLDTDKFYDKIVGKNRGGFCYELNGLYNELLRSIGFETRIVSARVFNGKDHGPEFDHAAIIVKIGEEEFLTDVGFGYFIAEPLCFVLDQEIQDAAGTFVIRKFDDGYLEVAKHEGDEWKSEYIFKDIARELSEFTEMCDFQQYSPESHFTKGKLCSLMTENGRKTLTDHKFLVTSMEERSEMEISSEEEFYAVLVSAFGIQKPL